MPKRVDMQAVAERAGVHQTTVSLALRGHPRIPARTRDRIRAIADEMGYRPNPLVSAFVANRQRGDLARKATLGYLLLDEPEVGGPKRHRDYLDLYEGARRRAEELGYGFETLWLADPALPRARFHQIVETRGIHGLIIAPAKNYRAHLELDWRRFAAVAYGFSMGEPRIHRVHLNSARDMQAIFKRALDYGYRRIGLALDENAHRKSEHVWLASYLAEQWRMPADDRVQPLILNAWSRMEVADWLERERVEVVVSLSSLLPVLGFDLERPPPRRRPPPFEIVLLNIGLYLSDYYAGVQLSRDAAGRACVDTVVSMLHRNEMGVPKHPQTILVDSVLREGESFRPRSVRAGT